MSVSITVRDIPEQTRNELAARAALTGRSLQEYLRAKLIELAGQPDAEALVARVRARKAAHPAELPSEQILRISRRGSPVTLVIDASAVVAALVDDGTDGTWAESLLTSDSLAAPHMLHAEASEHPAPLRACRGDIR